MQLFKQGKELLQCLYYNDDIMGSSIKVNEKWFLDLLACLQYDGRCKSTVSDIG